jgi:hypothetical protein
MKYFKVFGAERTATLYLKALIDENIKNTHVFINSFGSRHDPPMTSNQMKSWIVKNRRSTSRTAVRLLPKINRRQTKIYPIVIIKDPYIWYKSINRWRRGRGLDIQKEYKMYMDAYTSFMNLLVNTEMYGYFYGNGMYIRYEDLLRDPKKILTIVCNFYGISTINIRKKLVIPKKIENSNEFTEGKKQMYLSMGPYKMPMELINQITLLIDWDIIGTYYGYYPMDPRDFTELSRGGRAYLSSNMWKNEIIPILSKYGADSRVGVRDSPIF